MFYVLKKKKSKTCVCVCVCVCVQFQILFIYWLCWVFVAVCRHFSGCGEQGLLSSCGAQISHCSGFSYCRAHAVGAMI